MSATAIRLDGVGKRYGIGLPPLVSRALARLGGRGAPADSRFWALQDVTFEVAEGEVVGVVGPNGAGKSTLLKLLCGVTYPTTGAVQVRGRVTPLIQVGAGFHPELSGRENLYLNGIILGMSRAEIRRKEEEIIAFSGLERFIETPVKKYSSGMYVRLGFSIAVHADPEVMLVDEVLSVGDYAFRDKSYQKMLEIRDSGATILFVSHNLGATLAICERVIWLDGGRVQRDGEPDEVVGAYLAREDEKLTRTARSEAASEAAGEAPGKLRIRRLELVDGAGLVRDTFQTGDDITVRMHYEATERIVKPHFSLQISPAASGELLAAADMLIDGQAPEYLEGEGVLDCTFRAVPLLTGRYRLSLRVFGAFSMLKVVWPPISVPFSMETPAERRGWTPAVLYRTPGWIEIPYEWRRDALAASESAPRASAEEAP